MHKSSSYARVLLVAVLSVAVLVLGYPAAFMVQHGWNPPAWPGNLPLNPIAWLREWSVEIGVHYSINLRLIVGTYLEMLSGRSAAFAGGGFVEVVTIGTASIFFGSLILLGGKLVPLRDPTNIFGNAEWASAKDRARMNEGLEIGLDPESRRPIRIQVEGNLVTIAPPRMGKTGGLIIPNLLFPEPNAWDGPAVVVDPKGDVYRAVRRRREALGKTVRCIDPLNIAGGGDRWNPLCRIDPTDVIYLQSMALALLPPAAESDGNAAYFQSRASDLIVAAILATIRDGRPNPVGAAELLMHEDVMLRALEGRRDQASRAARQILKMEPRSRDGLVSTAQQATQWLRDERMQDAVLDHTFELSDLANGDVDLFLVLPADDRKKILAPYVRWLLADLFAAVRRDRPAERIIAFIDEAAVLGRFDAILQGSGELPGYGISLWTFWQTRQQMIDTYGPHGADTLIGTAEMVNLFNLPAALPDEIEHWSRAIGTYTGVTIARALDPQTGRVNETRAPEAVRLVPAPDLPGFLHRWQVVFLTSRFHTPNPLKLRRTIAAEDARFRGLADLPAPVGRIA